MIEQQSRAIRAYEKKFGHFDFMHPAYVEDPRFADVILDAIERGKPLTDEDLERRLFPVPWNW